MRILVTDANGTTGHAVIRHLVARGADVVGLVSQDSSRANIAGLGATPIVGDLRDIEALRLAMDGVERVYHICPAWLPDEVDIGEAVISAAQSSDISLFGYHSTIAPHLEEVPSHWAKMQVQMALMHSGLPFSIVQPAAYMRDAFEGLKGNNLEPPYRTDAPLSWVDVEDVGEAVAILMTRPDQAGGTYELCGTDTPLAAIDMAVILSQHRRQPIAARTMPIEEFVRHSPYTGFSAAQLDRVRAYFRFVDEFGMRACNSKILAMLLGRSPTPFGAVAERL
ncbi:MAG: NmrA family NAD(P)-binding protein [Alphaproteobacteria bacterium]|nr:NmrA family NAD(P)-binding protein [Alphaproteobacteria bacterium]